MSLLFVMTQLKVLWKFWKLALLSCHTAFVPYRSKIIVLPHLMVNTVNQ